MIGLGLAYRQPVTELIEARAPPAPPPYPSCPPYPSSPLIPLPPLPFRPLTPTIPLNPPPPQGPPYPSTHLPPPLSLTLFASLCPPPHTSSPPYLSGLLLLLAHVFMYMFNFSDDQQGRGKSALFARLDGADGVG